MKITILPFKQSAPYIDPITLHNLIKRADEDLRYANEMLREFYLKILVVATVSGYRNNPSAYFSLSDDESTVHLTIPTYLGQEPDIIYKALKDQLARIKSYFYV
jgi:hypothetical protein